MAKYSSDDVMDGALEVVAEATTLTVCSTQPTTRTEAISTYKLADVTMTPGDGNGDFTIANGDTTGRKVTISQKTNIPIDSSGTAAHVALCDGTRLIYVTTCDSVPIVSGNTVTVPAWDVESAIPRR